MDKNLLDLSQMSVQDKKSLLQDAYNQFFQKRGQDIVKDGFEIVDFGCNVGPSNNIVYTLTVVDKSGKTTTKLYDDDFDDIDVNLDELESLKALGADTTQIDEQLGLDENSQKTSLKEIQQEEQEQNQTIDQDLTQAIDNTVQTTGMQEEDVKKEVIEQGGKAALTDDGKSIKVKIDDIKGISYPEIDASQKVSINTTMKDLLGNEFVAFKTVITAGNEKHFYGIDQEGNAQEIGPDKIEFYSSSPSISLMQENGQTKDVQPDFVIGIKSQGTDSSKKMYIGGYKEGSGENSMFVARSTTDNKLLAAELPGRNSENRVEQERMMDTTKTDSVDVVDIVNKVAEEHGIEDPNDLYNEVGKWYDMDKVGKEEIESVADGMDREPGERTIEGENHPPYA